MTSMPRYVQLNNWLFEIKAVRALRVDHYGDPYSAIANISVNGEVAHIDGLMTREKDLFTRKDYQIFRDFCCQMQLKQVTFDRFKNNQLFTESLDVIPPPTISSLLEVV